MRSDKIAKRFYLSERTWKQSQSQSELYGLFAAVSFFAQNGMVTLIFCTNSSPSVWRFYSDKKESAEN
jgi:hypothetical protein